MRKPSVNDLSNIKHALKRGEVVEILPELATTGLPLHLVWPRSRQLSRKVDAFPSTMRSSMARCS
jgi:DNA-binding transcriptional LysR family regulator